GNAGSEAPFAVELAEAQKEAAEALARRLLARATADTPGYLVLNPCSFNRRLALELPDTPGPLPVGGAIKAAQTDGTTSQLGVEVPGLGFAWFPRTPGNTPNPPARMKLADGRIVRNEFFEAEVDPATGGLKSIRDNRTRMPRLAQQLVFNPGSTVRVKEIKT